MNGHNLSAHVEFTVEFYDVDAMGVVWHGNYVKYLEKARCALLDTIGFGYREMTATGYAFPVTDLKLKYIRPLRFGDRVRAKAVLEEYEDRLRINYELSGPDGGVTTRAVSTQMAYSMEAGVSLFECPRVFTEKVEALLAQGSEAEGKV
jgi:acyl-CoA thioester hydrolase